MGTGNCKYLRNLLFQGWILQGLLPHPCPKKRSIANSVEFAIFFLLLYLQEWHYIERIFQILQNLPYPWFMTWIKEIANMCVICNSKVGFCRHFFRTHVKKKRVSQILQNLRHSFSCCICKNCKFYRIHKTLFLDTQSELTRHVIQRRRAMTTVSVTINTDVTWLGFALTGWPSASAISYAM